MAKVLEPGQIVQVNGKDATVISVGDGIVHVEQDGEAISVNPADVTVPGAEEIPAGGEGKPADIPPVPEAQQASAGVSDAIIAEIVAIKQRVTALETRADRIEKVLAALTAGPAKSSESDSTAAPGEAPAATAPADSATEAGNAALPASD